MMKMNNIKSQKVFMDKNQKWMGKGKWRKKGN